MALKADRHELETDISFFYNAGTATRGGIVVLDTVGSGAAMDHAAAKVKYQTATYGNYAEAVPVGLLLNDVVNLDLTRQHINWHKDEVQKGGKVTLLKKGWVVTDKVYPGHTPAAGGLAYVAHSGLLATSNLATDQDDTVGATRVVGTFLSKKDEDGYVKVEIALPNNNVPSA